MNSAITYFETGSKEVHTVTGELFFGDALLGEYIGVKQDNGWHVFVPSSTVINITVPNMGDDEDLYKVDIASVRRSKEVALRRISKEMDRESGVGGGAFHG